MRVPRALIAGASPGSRHELGGEAYHHLVRVLRRRPGDPLVALDGRGGAFQARVEAVEATREVLVVVVGEPFAGATSGDSRLAAALGIPRGEGFELAIRWGSEMGLGTLIPLQSARVVARVLPERAAGKLERWRRIARESAEQCRRPTPLAVDPPAAFEAILARPADSRWIAIPDGTPLLRSGFPEALASGGPPGPSREILVLIGPEGGFEPLEVEQAAAAGFQPVGFPTPVMRAPTAIAYLASLWSLAEWLKND